MGRACLFLAATLMGRQPRQSCLRDRKVVMSTEQLTSKRKKGLAVCSAVITPLLMCCPSAGSTDRDSQTSSTHNTAGNQLIETRGALPGSSQGGFSIKVFTSRDDQFWANSIIVEGVHEVMLVDAQL